MGVKLDSVCLFTTHSGFLRRKVFISSGLVIPRILLRPGPSVGSF